MSAWAYMLGGGMPRNASCRGGVFATRRFPRPPTPHHTHAKIPIKRRGTPLQTPRCLHDHAGITTGNGGLDRMRGRGWDGRGNLRGNHEDPAPTVGRLRGWHCDPHCAQRPPIAAAMRVPCHPTRRPPMETLWSLQRHGTPRRYVLREMEFLD